MNLQIKALADLHQFFVSEEIQYVVIGGIALQYWGEPRFTRDIDVTVLLTLNKEEEILKKILTVFSPRVSDALEFAIKNRICLVKNKEGYEIDISLGIPGYEEEVIKRSVNCEIDKECIIKICSAEDLIIHKAVAGRPQDIADIESIILRQGNKLDANYIRKWLQEFSNLLETNEVPDRFDKPWKQFIE